MCLFFQYSCVCVCVCVENLNGLHHCGHWWGSSGHYSLHKHFTLAIEALSHQRLVWIQFSCPQRIENKPRWDRKPGAPRGRSSKTDLFQPHWAALGGHTCPPWHSWGMPQYASVAARACLQVSCASLQIREPFCLSLCTHELPILLCTMTHVIHPLCQRSRSIVQYIQVLSFADLNTMVNPLLSPLPVMVIDDKRSSWISQLFLHLTFRGCLFAQQQEMLIRCHGCLCRHC